MGQFITQDYDVKGYMYHKAGDPIEVKVLAFSHGVPSAPDRYLSEMGVSLDGVLPKGAIDLKLSTERLLLAALRRALAATGRTVLRQRLILVRRLRLRRGVRLVDDGDGVRRHDERLGVVAAR